MLLTVILTACSWADRAQIADATTTAIALNGGYAEANPVLGGLSAPAIAAVKIGATQLESRRRGYQGN